MSVLAKYSAVIQPKLEWFIISKWHKTLLSDSKQMYFAFS